MFQNYVAYTLLIMYFVKQSYKEKVGSAKSYKSQSLLQTAMPLDGIVWSNPQEISASGELPYKGL